MMLLSKGDPNGCLNINTALPGKKQEMPRITGACPQGAYSEVKPRKGPVKREGIAS